MLATIVIFILILCFVVLVHELGHFFFAKLFKVDVKEFGIGFPPRLCKLFHWRGTDFTLNLIPLGGFCAMEGELSGVEESKPVDQVTTAATTDSTAISTKSEKINPEKIDRAPKARADKKNFSGYFDHKKPWQKFLIIFAGPAANFILGALLFIIVFGVQGIPVFQQDKVFLESTEIGSPAAEAGLPINSQILTLTSSQEANITVTNINQVTDFISRHQGEMIALTTKSACDNTGYCSGQISETQVYVRSAAETPTGSGNLGIALSQYRTAFYPWYKQIALSIYYGFQESIQAVVELIQGLFIALTGLFQHQTNNVTVMGPVGIVSQLDYYHTFSGGFLVIIQFMAILSINLGVMNLLPLPALDGGRIILIFLEKLFGRRKIAKLEVGLNYFGLIFLLLLTVVITGQDIIRVIQGQ